VLDVYSVLQQSGDSELSVRESGPSMDKDSGQRSELELAAEAKQWREWMKQQLLGDSYTNTERSINI